MPTRCRIPALAVLLLSLALPIAAAPADAQSRLPIAIVPNLADLSDSGDATFSPNGQLLAVPNSQYQASTVTLFDIASGHPLRVLEDPAFFTAISFSPDGRSIASGHKDGSVKLWDLETGAIAATLRGGPNGEQDPAAVNSVWIDDKGEFLVAGDGAGAVAVWNIAQRKQTNAFQLPAVDAPGNHPNIVAARLSADRSRLIVLAQDRANNADSATVFDVATGTAKSSVKLPKDYAFTADGIVGDDEFVVRFSGDQCKIDRLMLFSLQDTNNFVSIYAPAKCEKPENGALSDAPRIFASSNRRKLIIAQAGDPEIRVWDVDARRAERAIKWPNDVGAKGLIGVSRDFRLAIVNDADKIRIYEIETGALVKELSSFGRFAENAVAARDGKYIFLFFERAGAAPKQKELALWKVDALSPKSTRLAGGDLTMFDASAEAMTALGGGDGGEVFLFSTQTGREERRFSLPGVKNIFKASLSPDGKTMLVLGEDANDNGDAARNIAVLADPGDGKIRRAFEGRGHEDGVSSIAFSADGARFVVGRRDGTAEVWSTDKLERVKHLPAYAGDDPDVWSLAFSKDGRLLLGGSLFDEKVFVWDMAAGRVARTIDMGVSRAHYRHASSLAVSRDGKLVAAGLAQRAVSSGDLGPESGGIQVWDRATGKLRFTLRGHGGGIFALTFSPDDRSIVSGSLDGTIRYWDRESGKWMATFAPAPDGRWIIMTESGFFAGSTDSGDLFSLVRGFQVASVAQLRDQLYRPDLVEQLLKGDPAGHYREAARKLDLEKVFESASIPPTEPVPARK